MEITYFRWLYEYIRRDDVSYTSLMTVLFETQFTYTITMDANREGDIIQLKEQYLSEHPDGRYSVPEYCSVFELLINLAKTMEYQSLIDHEVGDIRPYFYQLIDNIGILDFTDEFMDSYYGASIVVRSKIKDVLEHNYNPYSGDGSLFPVQNYGPDRTKMQLWDQLASYIVQES